LAFPANHQRAVTLRELAKEVGVSPSTVSRVLNRDPNVRVSETSRSRILDLAAATGYRPNRLARSLKLQRTNVIGMLIPDITNPLFSALFRAVDEVASAAGYHVILCNTGDSADRLRQHLDALSEGHVDGLLLATAHRNDPVVETLRRRRLPYILVSRRNENSDEAWVVPDDRQGAHLAVEHLVKLGHQRPTSPVLRRLAAPPTVSMAIETLWNLSALSNRFGSRLPVVSMRRRVKGALPNSWIVPKSRSPRPFSRRTISRL